MRWQTTAEVQESLLNVAREPVGAQTQAAALLQAAKRSPHRPAQRVRSRALPLAQPPLVGHLFAPASLPPHHYPELPLPIATKTPGRQQRPGSPLRPRVAQLGAWPTSPASHAAIHLRSPPACAHNPALLTHIQRTPISLTAHRPSGTNGPCPKPRANGRLGRNNPTPVHGELLGLS